MDHSPWPKKGNKLFAVQEGDTYFHLPSIRVLQPVHARAFREVAERVINECLANGNQPSDDVILIPVLYLYRHAIELYLKLIVHLAVELQLVRLQTVEQELKTHNLARLWSHVKTIVSCRWPEGDNRHLIGMESIINELHQSDPAGQAFRYAANSGGQLHRYERLPEHVGCGNLKITMAGALNFLEAVTSAFAQDHSDLREVD